MLNSISFDPFNSHDAFVNGHVQIVEDRLLVGPFSKGFCGFVQEDDRFFRESAGSSVGVGVLWCGNSSGWGDSPALLVDTGSRRGTVLSAENGSRMISRNHPRWMPMGLGCGGAGRRTFGAQSWSGLLTRSAEIEIEKKTGSLKVCILNWNGSVVSTQACSSSWNVLLVTMAVRFNRCQGKLQRFMHQKYYIRTSKCIFQGKRVSPFIFISHLNSKYTYPVMWSKVFSCSNISTETWKRRLYELIFYCPSFDCTKALKITLPYIGRTRHIFCDTQLQVKLIYKN